MSCRTIPPSCVPSLQLCWSAVPGLERLLKLAQDAQFGRSSEKLDTDQLQLLLEDIDQAVAALEAAEDHADSKAREKRAAERRASRGKLPEHLPLIVETLMPAETCCPCCKGHLIEIGRDESQRPRLRQFVKIGRGGACASSAVSLFCAR